VRDAVICEPLRTPADGSAGRCATYCSATSAETIARSPGNRSNPGPEHRHTYSPKRARTRNRAIGPLQLRTDTGPHARVGRSHDAGGATVLVPSSRVDQ
jgi:hypothetical protein